MGLQQKPEPGSSQVLLHTLMDMGSILGTKFNDVQDYTKLQEEPLCEGPLNKADLHSSLYIYMYIYIYIYINFNKISKPHTLNPQTLKHTPLYDLLYNPIERVQTIAHIRTIMWRLSRCFYMPYE